jgi:hypothetical protein
MLVKCICKNCAGHLEFEEENAGQKIKCPHCGFDTILFLPGAEQGEEQVASLMRKLQLQRRLFLWAGGAAILVGLGWCIYHWGLPVVQNLLPAVDSQLILVLVLALLCLSIPLVFIWLLLPVFLFFQVRKLMFLLARIEENLRSEPSEIEPEAPDSSRLELTEDARKL